MMNIKYLINDVLTKIFGSKQFQSNNLNMGINSLISEKMAAHFQLISALYGNDTSVIPWIKNQKSDENIKSLRLAAIIPREVARIACSEANISVSGNAKAEYINEQLKFITDNLQNIAEMAVLYGNIAFKPYVSNGGLFINICKIGEFVPLSADENCKITSAVFISKITKGSEYYTKLEQHTLSAGGIYTVESTAYRSVSEYSLGKQVKLGDVDVWAGIAPYVELTNIYTPLFAIYKNPFANTVDSDSILGSSILSDSIDLLEEADRTWEAIRYEMKSSERHIFASSQALSGYDNMISRVYRRFEADSDDFFQEFSPVIRTGTMEMFMQSIYKRIEQNTGLSFGIISDPNSVDKTATEIINSKQRMHSTVKSIQTAMQNTLNHLIEVMDIYINLYSDVLNVADFTKEKCTLVCDWDDSIIESKQDKQNWAALEQQQGLIDKVEYFIQTKGLTEDEAIAYVDKMEKRSQKSEGKDWFGGE